MAAIDPSKCTRQWQDGVAEKTALYALKNVSTGDTADLSADFSILKRGVLLGVTVAGAVSASVNGTGVSIPNGVANDACFLLVFGCAA